MSHRRRPRRSAAPGDGNGEEGEGEDQQAADEALEKAAQFRSRTTCCNGRMNPYAHWTVASLRSSLILFLFGWVVTLGLLGIGQHYLSQYFKLRFREHLFPTDPAYLAAVPQRLVRWLDPELWFVQVLVLVVLVAIVMRANTNGFEDDDPVPGDRKRSKKSKKSVSETSHERSEKQQLLVALYLLQTLGMAIMFASLGAWIINLIAPRPVPWFWEVCDPDGDVRASLMANGTVRALTNVPFGCARPPGDLSGYLFARLSFVGVQSGVLAVVTLGWVFFLLTPALRKRLRLHRGHGDLVYVDLRTHFWLYLFSCGIPFFILFGLNGLRVMERRDHFDSSLLGFFWGVTVTVVIAAGAGTVIAPAPWQNGAKDRDSGRVHSLVGEEHV